MRLKASVTTFHDLFVISGDYSSAEFRARFREQAIDAAQRSDLIICVSEFTARQVSSLLDVNADRIRVIHHGVDQIDPADVLPVAERKNTILFVGAVQRRKNVARLLKAFGELDCEWNLVIAGSTGYGGEEELRELASNPARDRISIRGYIDHVELQELYRSASILAFPSLDEGFGMPVLEGMANGLATLTSNCSAMPEVAGDCAVLVDPYSVDSIASGLKQLIEDAALCERLQKKGLARVRTFRWEESVQETAEVYRELGMSLQTE
jgi:glycosyltransferase involved in cell wall biosynthesis